MEVSSLLVLCFNDRGPPYLSRSGSANSTAKSLNGSIQSDLSAVDDFDGDNINVVVRVRPLNEREVKAGDEMAIQFPGDGGIWVRARSIIES